MKNKINALGDDLSDVSDPYTEQYREWGTTVAS